MEKDKVTPSPNLPPPLGICEKLFNAFHSTPAFRPLRRLTFRWQPEQPTASDGGAPPPSSTTVAPPHSITSATNGFKPLRSNGTVLTASKPQSLLLGPAVAAPATEKPEIAPSATIIEQPKVNSTAPANSTKPSEKVTPQTVAETVPKPTPPPALTSVTVPTQSVAPSKSRKNINERAHEYITKAEAKAKTRAGSGLSSRVPSSK